MIIIYGYSGYLILLLFRLFIIIFNSSVIIDNNYTWSMKQGVKYIFVNAWTHLSN